MCNCFFLIIRWRRMRFQLIRSRQRWSHAMNTITRSRLHKRRNNWFRNPACVLLFCALAGGCHSGKPESGADLKDKLVIKGSNTLGEELVPGLVTEYKKDHPGVTVETESKGTGSGFLALLAGNCD